MPTIMVDELRPYPRARHRCFRAGACHLTVDDETPEHIEALHAFAQRIGMKRSWFQDHRLAPHYDLTASKRERALQLGAVFVPAMDQARARIARRERRSEG
jgi:hypothetical protein